jgi:hypothetical protein
LAHVEHHSAHSHPAANVLVDWVGGLLDHRSFHDASESLISRWTAGAGSHAQELSRDAAVGRRVPLGVAGASGEEMTRDQQMTGEVAKKLVGAWRYVATTIDGVNKPRGNNPKGIIYYGPYGEMSVQIAPGRGRRGLSSRKVVADRPDQAADIARLIEV